MAANQLFGRIFNFNLWGRRPAPSSSTVRAVPARGPEGGYASMVEITPEPRELGETVREMDEDYQVAYARRVLAAQIAAVPVTISVDGPTDDRATAIASHLQTLWDDSVDAMQDAIGYGRRAFEKCWKYDPSAQVNYIHKLDPIEFGDSRLKLGERGRFEGVEIKVEKTREWELIPPDASWWLALDSTGKYPHGRSRYFPAPWRVWKDKKSAVLNMSRFLRRFAIRGGIAHIPMEGRDPETNLRIDNAEKMQESLEALYSGGTLLMPNDLHPSANDNRYAWDYQEADTRTLDPGPLLSAIDAYDVQILRAFGIPEKTVTEGDAVGSFAMVSNQMLTLFAVVESLLSQFAKSFNRYVADKVREVNYGVGRGPEFKVTFPQLTTRPDGFVVEVVKLLAANPTFIQAAMEGAVDLRQMLTSAGLPVVDGFEEIVKSVAQRMATAAGAAIVAPAEAAAMGSGEFGGVSRLQWKRNREAINDLVTEFINGDKTEAYALAMLQTLGLTEATARAVLQAASDGEITVDEANGVTASVGLANTVKVRAADGLAVPSQDALLAEALEEFDALFQALIDAMAAGQTDRVGELRQEIIDLQAGMRTASRVLGMLSPWAPGINTYGEGDAKRITSTIRMANELGGYRFPWLQRAMDFLFGKRVVTATQFAKMTKADKREVLSVPGVDSEKTLRSIRAKLAKATQDGTSLRDFRAAIADEVSLSRSQTETLYRTNVKQGYVAGMDDALASPAVDEEFPAVLYQASPDSRVRDAHWDLDGFVCLRSDRAYKVLKAALSDWNCRCTMIPLSLEDAESRGLKTYADLPASAVAEYA